MIFTKQFWNKAHRSELTDWLSTCNQGCHNFLESEEVLFENPWIIWTAFLAWFTEKVLWRLDGIPFLPDASVPDCMRRPRGWTWVRICRHLVLREGWGRSVQESRCDLPAPWGRPLWSRGWARRQQPSLPAVAHPSKTTLGRETHTEWRWEKNKSFTSIMTLEFASQIGEFVIEICIK